MTCGALLVSCYAAGLIYKLRQPNIISPLFIFTRLNTAYKLGMYTSNKKEQFNIAYIGAMAAQAGFDTLEPKVDDDSVDLYLTGKGFKGKIRNPQIQLQLKCTSQDLVSKDEIKFPLKRKNYDDLRGDDLVCPRYLVVMLVPKEEQKWIDHHTTGMTLHHNCYWVSIKNWPATKNTSVTVNIPLHQRVTTETLKNLMLSASERASP